ncbi:D-alanyl-D-alanine dipeptidase [Aquibacillus saliphilus]|uniref:D-alanyl-D-alanine dipeptidase n=1 Tax=Aquibacillus saliphilus TaxID=1909422 RepID=UPI001CEFB5C5|nr:D-alanyl-D-alanine dipeptidase [Aquibacillus saliphilus]
MKRYILLYLIFIFVISGCTSDDESTQQQEILNNQLKQLQESYTSIEQKNKLLNEEIKKLKSVNSDLSDELIKLKKIELERISTLKEETGLVNIKDIDDSIVVELRYATENNFVDKQVYKVEMPLLQKDTALKLKKANDLVKKSGYRIKLWDGYRPFDVQKIFWELTPDKEYLADPSQGSNHNRGTAVDITLVDEALNEVEMPTGFDEFSNKAWRSYQNNSQEAQKNMELLTDAMVKSGFTTINIEWWHFNDKSAKSYPVLNIPLTDFKSKINVNY